MSSLGSSLAFPLTPSMLPSISTADTAEIYPIIKTMHLLQANVEGGYSVETDRDPRKVPNPFTPTSHSDSTRNASTTIFYLLTSSSPKGIFHRNKARIVHTLHRGRGRYVIIHPADEGEGRGQKARIETFVVGQNIGKGERLQWIVEGDTYKASFLLPDDEGANESGGLLISETVVPGFEWADHDFLTKEKLSGLVTEVQAKELSWLLKDHYPSSQLRNLPPPSSTPG